MLVLILLFLSCSTDAQNHQLKSIAHGLEMMLNDFPKEQIIDEIRFEDGKDDNVDVIRFDHVGPNLFPLIISSKLPVSTDSLGILSFKLQKDTLANLLFMIDHVNPKVYSRKVDYVLIRVTYRYKKRQEQYYVTNGKVTTGFCKMIEKKLNTNKDQVALNKFYEFLARTGLFVCDEGKRAWRFE